MLFNSLTFLIFLPIVLTLYHALGHRAQNRMLLVASYVFYGWWDPRFLFLIAVSTLIDYGAALLMGRGGLSRQQMRRCSIFALLAAAIFVLFPWRAIELHVDQPGLIAIDWEQWRIAPLGWWVLGGTAGGVIVASMLARWISQMPESRRRRIALTASIVANLGLLAAFKYFNFFVHSAEAVLNDLGFDASLARLDVLLPVGISFYTFQTMSYTIDVYRGKLEPTDRLLDFALYVSYFPQLVAGPIERASTLLPRIMQPRQVTLDHVTRGCFLILLGMFQKVAIADGVAGSVDAVYAGAIAPTWLDIVAATGLFAVQIYCDFAGYSNIARGTSKLMGIDLMVNFNLPYFATNPSEFWQRWHISLSSWLRDYLYIPLGGNRHGLANTYRNLMLTMVLGGLWHGAAWNFALWGVYQGVVLCVHRAWTTSRTGVPLSAASTLSPLTEPAPLRRFSLPKIICIACFFAITCYGWLLFRATSFDQIASFTRTLIVDFGNAALTMPRPTLAAAAGIPLLLLLDIMQYRAGDARFYQWWPRPVRGALYAALLFITLLGTANAPAQFIYFQF